MKPITREDRIYAGEDVQTLTRDEYFLKQHVQESQGGGGSSLPPYTSSDIGKVLTVGEGIEYVIPEVTLTELEHITQPSDSYIYKYPGSLVAGKEYTITMEIGEQAETQTQTETATEDGPAIFIPFDGSFNAVYYPDLFGEYIVLTSAEQIPSGFSVTVMLSCAGGAEVTWSFKQGGAVGTYYVTENGNYDIAEYANVDVSVPASAVVSGTKSITANGTGIDVTNYAAVDVDVPPSDSSYTLLFTGTYEVNTTSTTVVTVAEVPISDLRTLNKIIYVKVRDKNGKRAGYFYGSDSFFVDFHKANGSTTAQMFAMRCLYSYDSSMKLKGTGASSIFASTDSDGVCGSAITNSNILKITAEYNSSIVGTINSEYQVDVYYLDWPDNDSPLD